MALRFVMFVIKDIAFDRMSVNSSNNARARNALEMLVGIMMAVAISSVIVAIFDVV